MPSSSPVSPTLWLVTSALDDSVLPYVVVSPKSTRESAGSSVFQVTVAPPRLSTETWMFESTGGVLSVPPEKVPSGVWAELPAASVLVTLK